jgi:PPOX class probable F420-dependent enzyme
LAKRGTSHSLLLWDPTITLKNLTGVSLVVCFEPPRPGRSPHDTGFYPLLTGGSFAHEANVNAPIGSGVTLVRHECLRGRAHARRRDPIAPIPFCAHAVYISMELDDTARALLDGPHTAILATSNAAGQPQSSVIFVKRDGDSVVFSTIKGRLKTRNMTRRPSVSLLVLSDGGRWVDIRGSVEITDDPDKLLLQEMYARYMHGQTPPPEPDAERLMVRITPEQVYVWPPA